MPQRLSRHRLWDSEPSWVGYDWPPSYFLQLSWGGYKKSWGLNQGSFRGERVGTPFPLLKSCRNAWERRSHCESVQERTGTQRSVKRQRNFLLSHQRFTSLHFFTFTLDNTIRENNWKPTFEIETKTNPLKWLPALLTNSQLLISDFVLISNGSKTNSSAGSEETRLFFEAQPLKKKHDSSGSAAIIYKRGLPMSICLSSLSVKRVYCDKTNESSADILIPYQRKIYLVFRHER